MRWLTLLFVFGMPAWTMAQTAPEMGYLYPPAAAAGSTNDVVVGGYNWTPDMQIFVHDPRIKLELVGPPGPVLVPDPPYWFGKKARDNDFPLPREFPGKLTIAADAPRGLVSWHAANANGATTAGVLFITDSADVREAHAERQPQTLPALPTAVVGQLFKLEEVDQYKFTAPQTGPVTLDLWSRRLQTTMNAIVEVRDPAGRLIADAADTAGHDLQLTFAAVAGAEYTVSLYDVDFRGHRSFVYRLAIQAGPRVVAAIPAAGKRGETRTIEFRGIGLATGQPQLESVSREVTFPADPALKTWDYRLETPHGVSLPYSFPLSNLSELVESDAANAVTVPVGVTGTLEQTAETDLLKITGKAGEVWSLTAQSRIAGLPLDLTLAVLDAEGKELARADDTPGTMDASLNFTVPADGVYQISVSDVSGRSGGKEAVYRVTVEPQTPGFQLTTVETIPVISGGKATLTVKAVRQGGFAGPITLKVTGIPEGVAIPAELIIPADKAELAIELTSDAAAAVKAGVVQIQGTAQQDNQTLTASTSPTIVAVVMKPRIKVTPEGLDDVRKWPRGTMYPAPVFIERLEGYTGGLVLEQTARQQRLRQGILGEDFPVAADATRVEYPVFLPEWLETTKTSRIILNSVVQIPDPQGHVRHLVNKMELRIGMLPVGALLKVSPQQPEMIVRSGNSFEVPLEISRSGELTDDVRLEYIASPELAGRLTAEPMLVPADMSAPRVQMTALAGEPLQGEHQLLFRATSQHLGKWIVISEATVLVEFEAR